MAAPSLTASLATPSTWAAGTTPRRAATFLLLLAPFAPLAVVPSLAFPHVTGPQFAFRVIMQVLVPLLGVLWWRGDGQRPLTPIGRAGALFLLAVAVAASLGVDPSHSVASSLARMGGLLGYAHLAILFLALAALLQMPAAWRAYLAAMVAAATVAALAGLAAGSAAVRAGSWFGNPTFLANFLLLHVFVAAFLAGTAARSWTRACAALAALPMLAALMMTGSRAALLGLAAGGAVLVLTRPWRLSRRVGALAGMAALLAAARVAWSALLWSPTARPLTWAALAVDPRVEIWGVAWRAFLERPWTGWGPENFDIAYDRLLSPGSANADPWVDRAHSLPLDLAVDGGFLLVIPAAWLIAQVLASLARDRASAPLLAGGVAWLCAMTVSVTTTTDLMGFATLAAFAQARGAPASAAPCPPAGSAWPVTAGVAILGLVLIVALTARPLASAYWTQRMASSGSMDAWRHSAPRALGWAGPHASEVAVLLVRRTTERLVAPGVPADAKAALLAESAALLERHAILPRTSHLPLGRGVLAFRDGQYRDAAALLAEAAARAPGRTAIADLHQRARARIAGP